MASKPGAATQPTAQPYGEVFDRGYQHYDGPRLGRSHAIRRLIIYSIKRGLGIKKRWTSKILPFILYSLAYVPAFVIVGLLAILPADNFTGIGFDSLYDVLEFVILIYAAALAPEMLCDDRRERTLQLYFSRPLTRLDYLVAKVSAMGILMSTIIFGPPLLLFIGLTLTDTSPFGYLRDHYADLLKIGSFGILMSAFFAAVSLTVATFTTRKGIAAAIVIIGYLMLAAIGNTFFEALDRSEGAGYFVFISPPDFMQALRFWLFRDDSENPLFAASNLPGITLLIWLAVIVAIAVFFMYRTYLTEE